MLSDCRNLSTDNGGCTNLTDNLLRRQELTFGAGSVRRRSSFPSPATGKAYFLLAFAQRMDLQLGVDIYEPRDLLWPSPSCGECRSASVG